MSVKTNRKRRRHSANRASLPERIESAALIACVGASIIIGVIFICCAMHYVVQAATA